MYVSFLPQVYYHRFGGCQNFFVDSVLQDLQRVFFWVLFSVEEIFTIITSMTEEETKIMRELWSRIQKKRKKLKISQEEFSAILGMDRSYLSMLEKWKANIAYLKLRKVADILDVEI